MWTDGDVVPTQPDLIERILADGSVRTVFQPIVDLEIGDVVAYEALSRGPEGPLERPDALFDAARAGRMLTELDELCRRVALTSAMRAGVYAPLTLFVNVEPAVLDSARLDELVTLAEQAPGELQVVLEITERAIGSRPAELLATVSRLRAAGWRIALDDVGADDMSLAFMPLLRPDIVKLDLSLVQRRPGPAVAEIMNAVNAYAERTGALLLAEGIEDRTHLEVARALGARLGQGWMFGRPSPTVSTILAPAGLQFPTAPASGVRESPFGCLPEGTPLRRSSKPLLIELSKFLEREAVRFGSTCMVVAAFQQARHFTAPTAQRYRELVDKVGFVAAVGEGLSAEPVAGLRGADLDPADPVRNEWNIIVLAPHFAAALLARDLGDGGPDVQRRFEFALTYDRATVAAAAEVLLSKIPTTQNGEAEFTYAGALSPTSAAGPTAPAPAGPAAASGPAGMDQTLRRALSASVNGVTIADVTRPDAPLVYVNTAFEKLSGLRAEQVLGTNCRILQGPGSDPAAVARLRSAIREGREARERILNYRAPNNEPWWNEIYLSPVFDDNAHLVQYIGIQNDVTAQVEAEQQLRGEQQRSARYMQEVEALAFTDPLTGMLNRRRLQDQLDGLLLQATMTRTGLGMLYIDVNDFKAINDRYGHVAGDRVLTTLSERLQSRLRRGDLTARMGGDEFIVVLPGLDFDNAAAEAHRVATACLESLSQPVTDTAETIGCTVSIGVATYPADGDSFDALYHAADARMYSAKPKSDRP